MRSCVACPVWRVADDEGDFMGFETSGNIFAGCRFDGRNEDEMADEQNCLVDQEMHCGECVGIEDLMDSACSEDAGK